MRDEGKLSAASSNLPLISLLASLFLALLFSPAFAYDDEETYSDPEAKARKAHEFAASDMIYQQEEWKALYYQNMKIIELLKEIRDSLESIKLRQAKDTEDTKL